MKKLEDMTTADEMINCEVQKINAGRRNESNLLRLVFLNKFKKELEMSWGNTFRSIDKEKLQLIWRAVSNEIKWLQTLLLQGKSIAMSSDIDRLKCSSGADEQIKSLKMQRDKTKANYYKGTSDYDRIVKEQADLKRNGLYDSKIDMKASDILKVVNDLSEESKLNFWLEYFKEADKFIYMAQAKENENNQMGQ